MLNSDKDLVTADPLNWMWQPWFIYRATLCFEPSSHLRLILSQTYLLTWSTQNSDFSWHSVVIIKEGEGRENTTTGSCFQKISVLWPQVSTFPSHIHWSVGTKKAISSHHLYSAVRRGKSPHLFSVWRPISKGDRIGCVLQGDWRPLFCLGQPVLRT